MDSVPFADIIEVIGLLELINDYGEKAPLDEIHNYTGIEFDELKPVVEAARMLGLIDVKGQTLTLTKEGKHLLEADPEDRKTFLAKRISQLNVFKELNALLKSKGYVEPEDLLNLIGKYTHEIDEALPNVISWGTYAMLFDYDHNTGKVLPWRD